MCRRSLFTALFTIAVVPGMAAEWSDPIEVRHDTRPVLAYRAKWDGAFLLVKADIQPGWHTFVMDNKQRQQEKLKGKPSLGIEKSTEISATSGLEVAGGWLQSTPKDFSKPEIRWFTWGFEKEVIFAAKARRTGAGPAQVEVRGQACFSDICKNIDVTLTVALSDKPAQTSEVDLKTLIAVR